MLFKCRVDDRQEFFEFLDRSHESYLNNIIFHDCAMDHERVVASIVVLFLIIAIQKAQRFRFLALYFVFERRQRDLTNALLATRIKRLQGRRRKRGALARRRRVVWVYPRPQGWFEEMYRNTVMFLLWKNDLRVSKETFDYICQLIGPYLSMQTTRLRKAIPLNKSVGIALWKLGTGNSYRTT